MPVSKEEYLKALNLVEEYHSQLKAEIVNHTHNLNDIGLKRLDYIVYIGGSESKHLTKYKSYRLTCKPYRNRVCVINDNGVRMCCNQSYFSIIDKK